MNQLPPRPVRALSVVLHAFPHEMPSAMMALVASSAAAVASSASPKKNYVDNCSVQQPWCNVSLPIASRLNDLVARLTVAEKIDQISTYSFTTNHSGYTPGVERLGLPPYNWHTEGLHGVRDASSAAGLHNSTLFPQVVGMAATGNTSLIGEMGRVMAREFRALNNVMRRDDRLVKRGGGLSVYGPTINIVRDARWGRNQETVSEDPWLSGTYAAAFMRGVQGVNEASKDDAYLAVAATCKHLDAYSLESAPLASDHGLIGATDEGPQFPLIASDEGSTLLMNAPPC